MPKFFVVSDIHGFFNEFKNALDNAGFDPNNENHYLVCCGDYFDRGPNPKELMDFLMGLERAILIKGNHEDLFIECCNRENFLSHDIRNETVNTIRQLGGDHAVFYEDCRIAKVKVTPFFDTMVDYFETKNYIFVHGWIPLIDDNNLPYYYRGGRNYSYNPDWRDSNDVEWEAARWINGINAGFSGLIEPNKTIVCGHWHCSYGHYRAGNSDNQEENFTPFYGDNFIAIDACTAYSKQVNVIVIEDEFLEE